MQESSVLGTRHHDAFCKVSSSRREEKPTVWAEEAVARLADRATGVMVVVVG